MSKLGSWGDVLRFEVRGDGNRILQPLETEETYEANWAAQSRIGLRPAAEFTGMDNEEVSMNVKLSAFRGVSPAAQIRRLKRAQEAGQAEYLILGGRRVSEGRMYIKSLRIRRERTMKRGELADATASITFRRYT